MPVIPSLLRVALFHGAYMKCDANYRYAPLDTESLWLIRKNWDHIRLKLAGDALPQYDVFTGLHFDHSKFASWLQQRGLDKVWPRTEKSGAYRTAKEAWESMATAGHDIEELHQLHDTITMPRFNPACDLDGRNRLLLGAMSTITSRNAPGNDKERGSYIFACPKWTRFLIRPPEGWGLFYLDWSAQEYGISAILSGDKNMLQSYESGDPYMSFAILAGAAPSGASKSTHPTIRRLYKTASLAISYGQEVHAFAARAKVPLCTAERVFADYERLYHRFLSWRSRIVDNFYASEHPHLATKLGWTLHKGVRTEGARWKTLLNFKQQSTGAGMLQIAAIRMMSKGVEVCCPVHDAILGQAPISYLDEAAALAGEAMDSASASLLDGYVLRRNLEVFRYPGRFVDSDGQAMWDKVSPILQELREDSCLMTSG